MQRGNGIYKSTDAGKTWKHVWKQEGQIGTLLVHPGNPAIAFAAVLGHAFGPNPERGVYRTKDGGRTWQQVLKKDADLVELVLPLSPQKYSAKPVDKISLNLELETTTPLKTVYSPTHTVQVERSGGRRACPCSRGRSASLSPICSTANRSSALAVCSTI